MSLLGLYDTVATGDWQREYLFKVTFRPPVLAAPLLPADIDIFIMDFKAPGSKQKVIKKDFSGQWANFAGPLENSGTTDVTFQVDENRQLFAFLEAWHALSGSDITAAALPKSDVIGEISATLYRTDKDTPVQTITLLNAWLPEIGDLALDKTKDGLLTVKVTIAYDGRQTTFN
jgi:hypothetical protein